jgi:hypothetical protein
MHIYRHSTLSHRHCISHYKAAPQACYRTAAASPTAKLRCKRVTSLPLQPATAKQLCTRIIAQPLQPATAKQLCKRIIAPPLEPATAKQLCKRIISPPLQPPLRSKHTHMHRFIAPLTIKNGSTSTTPHITHHKHFHITTNHMQHSQQHPQALSRLQRQACARSPRTFTSIIGSHTNL